MDTAAFRNRIAPRLAAALLLVHHRAAASGRTVLQTVLFCRTVLQTALFRRTVCKTVLFRRTVCKTVLPKPKAALVVLLLAGALLFPAAAHAQPQISIDAAPSVGEADGTAVISVFLDQPSQDTVTVQYQTFDDTATAPGDYTSTNGTVTFAPGETQKTISVTIIDDSTAEPTEYFTVQLSNPINAILAPGGDQASVAIIDDDGPPPTVQFGMSAYTVNENAGTASVDVYLSAQFGTTVTVDYATADGTAIAPGDYTASSGTLTFQPGETTKTIQVTIINDTTVEAQESFTVSLSNPTVATLGTQTTATVNIMDDDTPPPLPTVSFSSTDYQVYEPDGIVSVEVTLDTPSDQEVTVQYASSDGSAVQPDDYTAVNGTLTFLPGETTKTIDVTIVDDTISEATESFTLSLSSPTNATLGINMTATVTIDDDDPPTVQFLSTDYQVSESDGIVSIEVTLDAASEQQVTVQYATADGSAIAPDDYTDANGTLTFNPGETTKTIDVTIVDDFIGESDKNFSVELFSPTGATLGMQTTATVTILDDDGGLPTVQFSQSDYEFDEDEGTVSVTVTLSAPPVEDVSVDYQITGITATEGSDYTATSTGTLTFLAGENEKTIQITIVDDPDPEEAESIQLTISEPQSGAVAGAIMLATLYIVDNDQPLPTVQFDTDTYIVAENNGTVKVNVTLSKASTAPVKVICKSSDDSATAPDDYVTFKQEITFKAGETKKTAEVQIVDNAFPEEAEAFTLKLSSPSKTAVLGTQNTTKITIQDDDVPKFNVVAELKPDANQRGVTGDIVLSNKGGKGEKHYVSPKKDASYVILKAVVPKDTKFSDNFEWDGGTAGDTEDTRKVSRAQTGKFTVKIKLKGKADVVDSMNVWIVWATIQVTKKTDITVRHGNMKPKVGKIQKGVFAYSEWTFLATVEPAGILDQTADIPNLTGDKTQDVPGAQKIYFASNDKGTLAEGANLKWDMSRRIRLRIKSPTVSTNDHGAVGRANDGLPNANKVEEDYPADKAEGNDDPNTFHQDNNPYSDKEKQPGKGDGTFTPKGKIADFDQVITPVFRDGAGNNDDTYELHAQFGAFVRLQIGDSNAANYRNWYLVSAYADWRHAAILKKTNGSWGDNGSVAAPNNDNWK